MKEKQKTKKVEIQSTEFIIVNVFLAVIFIVSLSLTIVDKIKWQICWGDRNAIGVLCQIISATTFFVGSIIGIAITLQKEQVFGISYQEFNKLRGHNKYPVSMIIVLMIILSALNATFYVADLIIACLGMSLISIAFCIYITIKEIPLMMKKEKALLKVVKEKLYVELKNSKDSVLSSEIFKAIKYLSCHDQYTIKTTYDFFKNDDKEYNKQLLLTLLQAQEQMAFELSAIENKEEQRKIAGAIYSNIKDILFFKFDLTEELKKDAKNNTYYITRVLFGLEGIQEFTRDTADLIATRLVMMDQIKSQEKREFILSVGLPMISISVTTGSFSFAKAMRRKFSELKYLLSDKGSFSILFSVMSLHFYYLCNDALNVTQELKNDIKDFIEYSGVDDGTMIQSWKSLMEYSMENYCVNLQDLVRYFGLNDFNWDVHIYDAEAHFVVLTKRYILQWYLVCLFHSYNCWDFPYENLLYGDTEIEYYLKEIGDKIFADRSKPCFTEEMTKMEKFYDFDNRDLFWFNNDADENQGFFNFINKLHRKDLIDRQKKAEDIDNQELAKSYKVKITEGITSEWGYDQEIEIKDGPKYLNILIEKYSDAFNYQDVVVDGIVRSIFNYMAKNINCKIINKDIYYDENIAKLLECSDRLCFVSGGFTCAYFIKDVTLRDKFLDFIKKLKRIESKILKGNSFFAENSFAFNCYVSNIQVKELDSEEISKQAEKYKRTDGHYIYDGALFSREELEKTIKKLFCVLSIEIRCEIKAEQDTIFKINLFKDENNAEKKDEPQDQDDDDDKDKNNPDKGSSDDGNDDDKK